MSKLFDEDIIDKIKKKIDSYLDEASRTINKRLEEKKVEAGKRMFNVVDLNEREKQANASVVDLNEKERMEEMAKKQKELEVKMKQMKMDIEEKQEESTDKKMKMSPPWIVYLEKFKKLFEQDPELHIMFDDDNMELIVRVDNQTKYEALRELLPYKVDFGNVIMNLTLIPANEMVGTKNAARLMNEAFKGNPVVDNIIEIPNVFTNTLTYVMFKKEVVQYWSDNLGDPHGNESTLYQEIAKDIITGVDGVSYCTSTEP